MSKKSKAKNKQDRLNKKRAVKAANKAKYEERKRSGQNSKSKRFTLRKRRTKKVRQRHAGGACGNLGCKKCHPEFSGKQAA